MTPKTTPTAEPLPGVEMTSSNSGQPAQVSSMYSKPQPHNGYSNALDLASVPQMRMSGAHSNQNFIDFSLTQPEPYHSAFSTEFGFGASMQFGYPFIASQPPLPPHPTTAGGMTPISVLIPPPPLHVASDASTDPDPSGIGAGGDSFADFFPALLSENPLNGDSQEAIPAESGKKSVGDLFNLAAGLDVFEDPPVLERTVNREIAEANVKKGGSIESSWNQPLTDSNENNNANGSSLQANEKVSPFVHGSKEANETIVSEDSVNNLHPLGRMDSFGFATSLNSEAPGFDASVNTQISTTVPSVSNGNPNWPNFDQIPNPQAQAQSGMLIKADESGKSNSDELNINTETLIQRESTKVKGDQKVADRAKASPKGKKKKKKGGKSSSKEASSRSGNGAVRNGNITSVPPPPPTTTELRGGSTCTSEDASVALTEELVSIEERKPRGVNYSLSSSSTPSLVGVNSVAGFRSEGHTPPISTPDVTGGLPGTTTATTTTTARAAMSAQPFTDAVNSNENSSILPDLHSGTKMERQPPMEREIDDIFDGEFQDVSELAATFGKMEGKSSLLSSIMAARANKNKEADMSAQMDASDDISSFNLSAKVSVFERIKDIEDDSSQESHVNDQAKELMDGPQEGREAVQQYYYVNNTEIPTEGIPTQEVPKGTETTIEQLPQALSNHQDELVVPDTTVEPAKQPAKLENPVSEKEKLAIPKPTPEERDPVRGADSGLAIPTTNAGTLVSFVLHERMFF